jgi:hypothetical protein
MHILVRVLVIARVKPYETIARRVLHFYLNDGTLEKPG